MLAKMASMLLIYARKIPTIISMHLIDIFQFSTIGKKNQYFQNGLEATHSEYIWNHSVVLIGVEIYAQNFLTFS